MVSMSWRVGGVFTGAIAMASTGKPRTRPTHRHKSGDYAGMRSGRSPSRSAITMCYTDGEPIGIPRARPTGVSTHV